MIIQRYASLCGAVASTCRFKPMCYMNHILIEFMKYTRYIIHVAPATRFLHLTFSIRLPAVESNLSPERRYTERQNKIRSFQLYVANSEKRVCCMTNRLQMYICSMPAFSFKKLSFSINIRLVCSQRRSFNFEGLIQTSQKVDRELNGQPSDLYTYCPFPDLREQIETSTQTEYISLSFIITNNFATSSQLLVAQFFTKTEFKNWASSYCIRACDTARSLVEDAHERGKSFKLACTLALTEYTFVGL